MIQKGCVFISKAMFFETRTQKHKPIFVSGRDFYSLTYRYSGQTSITVGDTELLSRADTVTFMPKGLSYKTEITEDVHMAAVHFDFECEDPPTEPIVLNVQNTQLRSLFKALIKNDGNLSADFSGMSVFYEILAELQTLSAPSLSPAIPQKIKKARDIIDREFCDPYFSVTELSEKVGVSTAYLRREFRAAFGTSPISYLKRLRIERAKRLLLTEGQPITILASDCGYSGANYFIQDFHKTTGESPGEYRKRLLDSP